MLLGLISLLMAPAGLALMGRATEHSATTAANNDAPSLSVALRSATRHRGFWLLNLGFFVCGFHLSFIAVHLPMFVSVSGLAPSIAATGLALIGLFNIFGTLTAGYLGGRYRKKWLLSGLYGMRAVVILVFFFSPKTATTLLVFSAAIGVLWLPTVPLTSGIVAQIFGPRFLASLFGVVLFFHQVGAFFGAWLGGVVFDQTGNFDLVWLISIALGIMAMLVHLPIRDAKIQWEEPMDLAPAAEG